MIVSAFAIAALVQVIALIVCAISVCATNRTLRAGWGSTGYSPAWVGQDGNGWRLNMRTMREERVDAGQVRNERAERAERYMADLRAGRY